MSELADLPRGDTLRAEPTRADGRPLTARGLRTRNSILSAAEQVFAEVGYHQASVVKITDAARVGQGTFYIYFESKQMVFEEVVRSLNRQARHAMSEKAKSAQTRAEAERLGFAGYFGFVAEHPALYRIIRQSEIVAPGVLREHYEAISAGYVAGLSMAMDDGEIARANPEALAWILMGIGEIVGARWILWEDNGEVPTEIFETLITFVQRGLGATGSDT